MVLHVKSLCSLSLIIACFPIFVHAAEVMPVYPVPVVAHRGFSYAAPENTLASTRLAIEAGSDGCECDVYRTADGKIVLMHDENLKRTTGIDGVITAFDYETLAKLDAGSWKSSDFKGEKIPTLDEFLAEFKGTDCRPVVEIKMEGIEKPVVDAIKKAGLLDKTVVIAFSSNVVRKIREHEPNLSVAWLYGKKHEGTPLELADILTAEAKKCNTNILDLNHELISPELLKILRNRSFFVWAWTVDDPERMKTLLRWGIDSITTNRPDLLREIMQ